jgi:hypothetical protein
VRGFVYLMLGVQFVRRESLLVDGNFF